MHTVYLPTSQKQQVTECRNPVETVDEIAVVDIQEGRLELNIGSEQRQFIVSNKSIREKVGPD